jgi:hypothetical protein
MKEIPKVDEVKNDVFQPLNTDIFNISDSKEPPDKLKNYYSKADDSIYNISDSKEPPNTFEKPDSRDENSIFTTSESKEPPDRSEKSDASSTEQIEELRQEYIEDLKQNSEYSDTIQDDGEPYEKISPEENAKLREEFVDINPENEHNKEALIKKWEEENGKEWPRYTEDVYTHNGKLIRRAGDRYDAHHIHPLSMGGKNEASNITPMHAEKHYDKQGVHSSDSPYGKLEKTL